MANGASRGSDFERSFCYEFSKWLTRDLDEPRDDVVWRTAGSGSRSTTRAKSGKQTHGSTGDIEPTHPIARPFFHVCSIELKYGYGSWCLIDTLDKKGTTKLCQFEQFWLQAVRDAHSVTPAKHPILVTRRTNRRCVLSCGSALFSRLVSQFGHPNTTIIKICSDNPNLPEQCRDIISFPLQKFYEWVDPSLFLELAKENGYVAETMS